MPRVLSSLKYTVNPKLVDAVELLSADERDWLVTFPGPLQHGALRVLGYRKSRRLMSLPQDLGCEQCRKAGWECFIARQPPQRGRQPPRIPNAKCASCREMKRVCSFFNADGGESDSSRSYDDDADEEERDDDETEGSECHGHHGAADSDGEGQAPRRRRRRRSSTSSDDSRASREGRKRRGGLSGPGIQLNPPDSLVPPQNRDRTRGDSTNGHKNSQGKDFKPRTTRRYSSSPEAEPTRARGTLKQPNGKSKDKAGSGGFDNEGRHSTYPPPESSSSRRHRLCQSQAQGEADTADQAYYNVDAAFFTAAKWTIAAPLATSLRPSDLERVPHLSSVRGLYGTDAVLFAQKNERGVLPAYLYLASAPCTNCEKRSTRCLLADVPAPPPPDLNVVAMLRLPPCIVCAASGHDCRTALVLPTQTVLARVYAVVWPTPRQPGGDDDKVWYDTSEAYAVDPS